MNFVSGRDDGVPASKAPLRFLLSTAYPLTKEPQRTSSAVLAVSATNVLAVDTPSSPTGDGQGPPSGAIDRPN